MRKGAETLPAGTTVEPLSSASYRVIFQTRYESGFDFVMESMESNYRTIRWESTT
ncbi:MAG: hypothetical protein A07HB70_01389 [uncultured archaeon A07HB70]|nr:MAG: hypothetical protein A07HB70_01389 [uncultured archaeon A07HB70]